MVRHKAADCNCCAPTERRPQPRQNATLRKVTGPHKPKRYRLHLGHLGHTIHGESFEVQHWTEAEFRAIPLHKRPPASEIGRIPGFRFRIEFQNQN